jgi:exopolysaccharide biosynthesis protein
VLTINLNEPAVRVSIETARALPHGDESFAELLARSHPVAAINGTFFGKDNLRPIGDLVIQGKLRHSGRMGPVLAITPQNQALIRRVEWGRSQDWSAYDTVLGCGPTLLRAGEIDVQPDLERFRDPHVLGMSNRSAAGLTPANKLLLVSIPSAVSLTKLAEIMRELGCQEAMNLDGGASMAMYYRGKTILPAGRRLTNILVVYQNPEN